MYRYAPLLQRSCRSLLPSVGLSSTRYTTARSFFSTPFPPRPPRNTDEYRSTNNEYPTYSSGTSEIVEAGERGDWQRVEQLFEAAAASPARAAAASLSHADVKVYLEALVHTNRLHSLSLPNLTKVLLALSPGRPSPYRPTDTAASSDRSPRRTSSSPPPTLATSPSQPLHVAIASSTSAPWQRAASVLQVLTSLAGLGLFVYIFSSLSGGGKKGGAGPFTVQATHQLAETPAVRFADVAGVDEAVAEVAEVVEYLRNPRKFTRLGARLPAGVLLSGPPGTGKTLLARAIAGEAGVPFFFASGSSFDEMFVGVGAKRVRDLFEDAKKHAPCIVFIDEIDAVGGARHDDGAGGDNEVQRTMLELINQLDGFDARGNIKVLMATNRPDTLDPALLRPGRLDRRIEFGLPDLEGRAQIFTIHARQMNIARDIRFELLARLTPNATGADIRSVCTEAGMFAIRQRRKVILEKDFLDAIEKVIRGNARFSATSRYMIHN
uniref:AAA+ ATPase domain-containing protein n=1 Tax=Sexangularia sp. CB-2014 TaxID=1486929 RepID=A0A7S1VDN5_9EUKA